MTSARRDHIILASLVGAYLLILALMATQGKFGFFWKTVLVPFFFLAALVAGRGVKFVQDWGGYLSLVVLYDCLRGLIFSLVTRYDLPYYMNYAIDAEKALGRGEIYPLLLQRWWGGGAAAPFLNKAFVMVHSSHFFVFLMFGLVVWILRPGEFRRYTAGMLAVMYLGALFYLLIPTIPPWMAANAIGVIPPIRHVSAEIYSVVVPALQESFDTNPIAAMPSLHAAFPTLCALIGFRLFRWRALPLAVYALLVYVAIVYLGEHYLVDVLAGILFAALLHLLVYGWGASRPPLAALTDRLPRLPLYARHPLAAAILFSMAVVAASEGVGRIATSLRADFDLSPAFIAREMRRYPGVAEDLLFERAAARSKYRKALAEARVYGRMGKHPQGIALIERVVVRSGKEPEALFWLSYYRHRGGVIDADGLWGAFRQVEASLDPGQAALLRDFLLPTVAARP